MKDEKIQWINIGLTEENDCKGDFPAVTFTHTHTPRLLIKRLTQAWNNNRLAHRFVVKLGDNLYSFTRYELQTIISKHIQAAGDPQYNLQSWAELALPKYDPTNKK
jgi:hypothetical protein